MALKGEKVPKEPFSLNSLEAAAAGRSFDLHKMTAQYFIFYSGPFLSVKSPSFPPALNILFLALSSIKRRVYRISQHEKM